MFYSHFKSSNVTLAFCTGNMILKVKKKPNTIAHYPEAKYRPREDTCYIFMTAKQ